MGTRFTDRAQRVILIAQEEAKRLNHDYVGTEHILLGLIALGEGVAAQVLANLGVDLRRVRSEIEKIVGDSGTAMEVDDVLLVSAEDAIHIGTPRLEGVKRRGRREPPLRPRLASPQLPPLRGRQREATALDLEARPALAPVLATVHHGTVFCSWLHRAKTAIVPPASPPLHRDVDRAPPGAYHASLSPRSPHCLWPDRCLAQRLQ